MGLRQRPLLRVLGALTLVITACTPDAVEPGASRVQPQFGGAFSDSGIPASAVCTVNGGDPVQPFVLPAGFAQTIVAREGDGGTNDLWDMNTLNETGAQRGRFLYRAHEVGNNGMVSVTDLQTGTTSILAQRSDWERLDGIAWTPWGTILTAEETNGAARRALGAAGDSWTGLRDQPGDRRVSRPASGRLALARGAAFRPQRQSSSSSATA